MAKVVLKSLGRDIADGIGRLEVEDVPEQGGDGAQPKRGKVALDVRAASVNFPDLLMTCGGYQYKPRLPYTPGTEASGVVLAVGAGVENLKAGDKVMVGLQEGCMQSRVDEVPAVACTPLPEGLTFAEGAAFLVAYTTAYHCLVERGRCGPEDAVLINGATGGVGLAAVQVAKAAGCRTIIATGSAATKLEVASRHGATHCFDFSAPDSPVSRLGTTLKEWTSGRGVDVVYDPVGGEVFEESVRGTAWGARILIVGFASGVRPVVRTNYALIKGLTLMGCRAGESVRKNPSLQGPRMARLLQWVREGRLRPHISHEFEARRVRDAFAIVFERKVTGKAVLTFATSETSAERSRL